MKSSRMKPSLFTMPKNGQMGKDTHPISDGGLKHKKPLKDKTESIYL